MYEPKNFEGALKKMARIVRHVTGGEIVLFYITESGANQSKYVERALRSQDIDVYPYLLLESSPEKTDGRGYKVFNGIAKQDKRGRVLVEPSEVGELGIPIGFAWDDIATQYRHVVGSLLYLSSNKSQLGIRQLMLGLDKEMNTPSLAHISVDPFSDTVRFGDRVGLLRKVKELAPNGYQQHKRDLEDLLFGTVPEELTPGYRIGPPYITRVQLLKAS